MVGSIELVNRLPEAEQGLLLLFRFGTLNLLLLEITQSLFTLDHHVRVQVVSARNVDGQDRPQGPNQLLVDLSCWFPRPVDEPALARDAHRVQDEECVVSEPAQEVRRVRG